MYPTPFPRELLSHLERLQRHLQATDAPANIRGAQPGFPALTVEASADAVDIVAFVPGVAPDSLDLQLEKGLLTLTGERRVDALPERAAVHVDERWAGRFRRVVQLPEDADTDAIEARCTDGVLHVRVARKQPAQPRRIVVQ